MNSTLPRKVFGSKSSEIMIAPNRAATNSTQMAAVSADTIVSLVAGVYKHIMWPKTVYYYYY
jgi:hypothetical protein